MTSVRNPLTDLVLTPQQQSLLFAALNSNRATGSQANNGLTMSPSTFAGSPAQPNHGFRSATDSPLLDFDYDFNNADSSFDFSFDNGDGSRMIGDLPGAPSTARSESASDQDSPDKRSHPDDDEEENGAKRRESEDKVSKKPGRKPLTTEPTSKRKAQNRAAQRAFRERKEKHLKDLETKVQELEKASQAVNHENELLKQKVEKMTVELSEYKKRVTIQNTSGHSASILANNNLRTFGQPVVSSVNDVNFQFEFPKFGVLPGPSPASTKDSSKSPAVASIKRSSSDLSRQNSHSPGNSSTYSQIGLDSQMKEDVAKIGANLFNTHMPGSTGSRTSFDSHPATNTSSPSASSNSNMGASSSCGTSPEPFTQSPNGFKPVDTLTTIGEESATIQDSNQGLGHFSNVKMANMADFNWLPQTNFEFDPQLFGDYREPQNNVLSSGAFDDSFFNDAFDVDFITPYNVPVTTNAGNTKKPGLIEQIDAAKNTDELDSNGNLLTCNKIWERLQNCPKVQNGDFDLDGLCSELQKKAKCSGSGAVVEEREFKTVMRKYLGNPTKACEAAENARTEREGQKALGQTA